MWHTICFVFYHKNKPSAVYSSGKLKKTTFKWVPDLDELIKPLI